MNINYQCNLILLDIFIDELQKTLYYIHLTQLEEALNEKSSAENLQKLVREIDERNFSYRGDDAVCRAVARNPNTPPDTLKELFSKYHYPFEVLENPVLELLLLENPNFVNELFEGHTIIGYDRDGTIDFLDTWAASHQNKFIRIAVARNLETVEIVLEELAEDSDRDVRLAVANNNSTNCDTLKKLIEDEDIEVRNAAMNKYNKRTEYSWLKDFCF